MQSMKKTFIYFALLSFAAVHQVHSQDDYSSPYNQTEQPVPSSADTSSDSSTGSVYPEATTPSADAPVIDTDITETSSQTATSSVPVARQKPESGESSYFKKGIGIQSGVRFHDPDVFNEFVTAAWNAYIEDYIYLPADDKRIGPGVFLTLNGSFDFGKYFQVAPFMQGMWAGKWFYFTGGITKDLFINTYTAMGGVNLWGRLPFNRFSARLGVGGYGAYTIAAFTGDIKEQRISGKGYGFRVLIGSELRLSRHFVLTLDCAMPFGVSELDSKSSLKTDGSSVRFPTKMEHSGFEIIPGALFYF